MTPSPFVFLLASTDLSHRSIKKSLSGAYIVSSFESFFHVSEKTKTVFSLFVFTSDFRSERFLALL